MKNLKDSILEKLKVDDNILDKKFPIDGKIDDIIKFLEEKGFKEVECIENCAISKQIKKTNDKIFITFENNRIWFADTSKEKISEKNPIFYIDTDDRMFSAFVDINLNIVEDDKKAFLKELNKRFGWE